MLTRSILCKKRYVIATVKTGDIVFTIGRIIITLPISIAIYMLIIAKETTVPCTTKIFNKAKSFLIFKILLFGINTAIHPIDEIAYDMNVAAIGEKVPANP